MMAQSFVRQYLFRRFFEWVDRKLERRDQQRWSDELENEIEQQMMGRM
jgi:hypothetical protein